MKDDPSDPDHVPSIFCYTPVAKNRRRHCRRRLKDTRESMREITKKQRSLAASALLDLAKDDGNTVQGFGVQADPVHVESRGT